MIRFNVFGNRIGVERSDSGWTTYYLGNEGKRRLSDFVIPDFIAEDEIGQYLADLFHESASSECPDVKRIVPDRGDGP